MTTLTPRAEAFVRTLHREAPLETDVVGRLIEAEGVSPPQCWLDFHEKFAGFWENLGAGDVAVWGLARASEGNFCRAREVCIFRTLGNVRGIACADVHPSHGYEIQRSGRVLTPHFAAQTFATRVERLAAWAEFTSHGPATRLVGAERFPAAERQAVLDAVVDGLVHEASDHYARYYLTVPRIVFENSKTGALTVFERP